MRPLPALRDSPEAWTQRAERQGWGRALGLYLLLAALTTLPGLGAGNLIKMEGMVLLY